MLSESLQNLSHAKATEIALAHETVNSTQQNWYMGGATTVCGFQEHGH